MKRQPSHPLLPALVFALVLPFFLNRKWRVAQRTMLPVSPEKVFRFLNDLRKWQIWTKWAVHDGVQVSFGEITSGVGAIQRWESARQQCVMTITHSIPNERLIFEVQVGKCRLIEGAFSLENIDGNTRLTWFCTWESGSNPYGRYLDLYAKWRLNHDFQISLENLRDFFLQLEPGQ